MSQSEWIVASIVGGFLVFLAIKQKLPAYWSLLVGGGSGQAGTSSPSSQASGLGGALAGPAVGAAGAAAGTVAGTVTGNGQTGTQVYNLLPGVSLADPLSLVMF